MATPTTLPASFVSGAVLTAAQLNDLRGAFRVLQVVSTTDTSTFTSSQATNAEVEYTALATTITPSATSSQILLIASLNLATGNNPGGTFAFRRNTTNIGIGAAAGSRAQVTSQSNIGIASDENTVSTMGLFLDSPATTSATTYRIMLRNVKMGGPHTLYANRAQADPNGNGAGFYGSRSVSTLTVMEISA